MNDVSEVVASGVVLGSLAAAETAVFAEDGSSKSTTDGVAWKDVAVASAEAQQPDVERETITDEIDIPADPERIGRELVLVDNKIKACRTDYDAAKATLKAKKAALEAAEGERDELIDALRTHVQTIHGVFVVESDFRSLTERWIDEHGELVREIPLSAERRQTKLFDNSHSLAETGEGEAADDDADGDADGDAEEEDAESQVLEDRLDRALAEADAAFDDSTNVTDPEGLLGATAAPTHADPPSKPSRRARKAK